MADDFPSQLNKRPWINSWQPKYKSLNSKINLIIMVIIGSDSIF